MLYDKSVVPVILRQHGFQDSFLYNLEDTIKIHAVNQSMQSAFQHTATNLKNDYIKNNNTFAIILRTANVYFTTLIEGWSIKTQPLFLTISLKVNYKLIFATCKE